jgi:membrane dipeptidase
MPAPTLPPLVDSHLDMAGNVLGGRDYSLTAHEVRALENKTSFECMVTLPELRRAGVAVAFSTLYVGPADNDGPEPIYDPPADVQARQQLDVYRGWVGAGLARIVLDRAGLDAHMERWLEDGVPGLVILMESADPIATPADLGQWWDYGVRVIGPAWSRTRYSGGTGRPGGLTEMGKELVARMRDSGVILDASHMAEQSFWDAMEVGVHRVIATHSNARALNPSDRQITDDMISAIGERDGVVGMCMASGMLNGDWHDGEEVLRVTLADVRRHAEHIAGLIGWDHLGIGSDFDGGLGKQETPDEFDVEADLRRVAEVVPENSRDAVLGGNWLRFLRDALP